MADIKINDISFEVPFSYKRISLAQYVEYQEKFGRELNKEFGVIYKMPKETKEQEDLKNAALELHMDHEGLAWFSYWTGFDLLMEFNHFKEKHSSWIGPLLEHYRALMPLLYSESDCIKTFDTDIAWNNETWAISKGKDIKEKQIFNQVHADFLNVLYKNYWPRIIFPVAIHLRKKGEKIEDFLIYDKNNPLQHYSIKPERIELIQSMPMNICMSVFAILRDEFLGINKIKNVG